MNIEEKKVNCRELEWIVAEEVVVWCTMQPSSSWSGNVPVTSARYPFKTGAREKSVNNQKTFFVKNV